VEWPAEAFQSAKDPIAICTLTYNPRQHRALEDTVQGKTIQGRALAVRQVSNATQSNTCQVLFVDASERKRAAAILPELKATGILTVWETGGSAAEGGVINIRVEGGRARFEINENTAERAKLHISSKLLSLAEVVKK
jgi:hypothetical protein